MIIRKATIEDLKAIQDLSHALFEHDEDWIPGLVMDWSYADAGRKFFEDHMTQKNNCCFVAETNEQIIGYITGTVKDPLSWRNLKIVELDNMIVEEQFRNEGVGQQLVVELKKWAKEQGAQRINVIASYPNNNAIKFYKSVGFEPYSLELEMEL